MDRDHLRRLERELVDKGKLIEAGWVGYRLAVMPEDVSRVQLDETRKAFFAGSQHLFGSIMSFLDDGEEATEDDMRRMDMISTELAAFLVDFKRRHGLQDPRN